MTLAGGCYCGALRYVAERAAKFRLQCHCRACQTIAGGGPNYTIAMPRSGFRYTAGTPRRFARPDLAQPVTREFCGECGTHILTQAPGMPGTALIKVGSLDDPEAFGGPELAIFAAEAASFHPIPDGIACYEGAPG